MAGEMKQDESTRIGVADPGAGLPPARTASTGAPWIVVLLSRQRDARAATDLHRGAGFYETPEANARLWSEKSISPGLPPLIQPLGAIAGALHGGR